MRDSRGRLYQRVPLSKEGAAAWKEYIRAMDAEFSRAYGRPRKRGERLDAGSYLEMNNAFADEVAEAMEAAGADPALIYAFQKTGLFVTEMNERLIPLADLKSGVQQSSNTERAQFAGEKRSTTERWNRCSRST